MIGRNGAMGEEKSRDGRREGKKYGRGGDERGGEGRIKRVREGTSKTIFSSPYLQVNCKLLHAHQLLL